MTTRSAPGSRETVILTGAILWVAGRIRLARAHHVEWRAHTLAGRPLAQDGTTMRAHASRHVRSRDPAGLGVDAGILVGAIAGVLLVSAGATGESATAVIAVLAGMLVIGLCGAILGFAIERRQVHVLAPQPSRVRPPPAEEIDLATVLGPAFDEEDAAEPPPGWYPDPHGSPSSRYWDGGCWTEHLWIPRERVG